MLDDDEVPSEPSPLRVGMHLDRYEIVASLASGGMGAVWLARLQGVRGFEKIVAIKTIRPQYSANGRFERMFLDEARISSRLQHPNIAPILELGEQEGVLYLVMEYVDGETLSRLRRTSQEAGQRVPLAIALRVLADACAGLHAAHELQDEQGNQLCVVHRDASPHNILVATNGTVKVIDFGVAKARDRCSEETTMGELKGKLQYMPREQAMSADIDRRADIWSIGACLYELVAGRLPWEAAAATATVRRLMDMEPPRALPSDVPKVVRAILSRSLVHDREARFPTALAMRRALEDAMVALGLRATSEDVGVFIRGICAASIAERKRILIEALGASSSPDAARHRAAPTSLDAISVATDHFAAARDELPPSSRSDQRESTAVTRAVRPRLVVETNGMRTPTPHATSSPPPRFEKPRRRSSLGVLGLVGLMVAGVAVFLARTPASSIRDRMDAPPSPALSPLSAPSAPVVEHLASPTCPSEMAAVAEPLTWTPFCIDKVAIAIEGNKNCPPSAPKSAKNAANVANSAKNVPCPAARDQANQHCVAQGKRLASDPEVGLALTNELIEIAKPKLQTGKSSEAPSFHCARSL